MYSRLYPDGSVVDVAGLLEEWRRQNEPPTLEEQRRRFGKRRQFGCRCTERFTRGACLARPAPWRDSMKKVELWDITDASFLAFIMPAPSGVIYTNQCGGYSCTHPELEGVLVPVLPRGEPHAFDSLENWWCGFDPRDAASQIQDWLEGWELNNLFEPAPEHVAGVTSWGEAWVPVRIKPNDNPLFVNLVGQLGVLTYPNSD